jgi:hypothetical protein
LLKKSITFETFNDETVTEDHYFHLSKADLVELEVSHQGGMSGWIDRIVASQDGKELIDEFRKLILWAYGKKSDDGRRFIKTAELRDDFQSSPAYEALFMELVTDADAAAEFVNGIVPKGLGKDMEKMKRSTNAKDEAERVRELSDEEVVETAADMDANVFETSKTRVLTLQELVEMDAEVLKAGLAMGKFILPQ